MHLGTGTNILIKYRDCNLRHIFKTLDFKVLSKFLLIHPKLISSLNESELRIMITDSNSDAGFTNWWIRLIPWSIPYSSQLGLYLTLIYYFNGFGYYHSFAISMLVEILKKVHKNKILDKNLRF